MRRLKPLAVLPKEKSRLSCSMVRMRRSRSLRTSSLTASSSGVGRCCTTKSKRQSERPATKRCLDARGWEGSVWECETWRGAILAECCCVATAMGEWVQAGATVGREVMKRRRRVGGGGMCDSATHGREPLRSVTIGFLYVCCPSVRLSYPPLPYLLPFRPTSLYVQAMSSRFPACYPSGQQYSTYSCDRSAASATDVRTLLFYFCPFLVPDQYVIYLLR